MRMLARIRTLAAREVGRTGSLLCTVAALLASPSAAQPLEHNPECDEGGRSESSRNWGQDRGLSLYFQLLSNEVDRPNLPTGNTGLLVQKEGDGVDLGLAYSFNPSFALQFSIAAASHTISGTNIDAFYSTATLEAHWRFSEQKRGRPYLFAGLGASSFDVDEDGLRLNADGGVAVLGVGYLYNLSQHLVFDAAIRADFIDWEDVQRNWGHRDRSRDGSDRAAKLRLGLRWDF